MCIRDRDQVQQTTRGAEENLDHTTDDHGGDEVGCVQHLSLIHILWRKNKVGLKEHTFANYVYMYNRFVRDEIGMMKLCLLYTSRCV